MDVELDITGLRIFIACPVNRDFPWQTTRSFIETAQMLTARNVPHQFQFLTQGSQIDFDRSELAHQFLKSDYNRLFWIDSDMSWAPEDFLKIMALSTVMPIVGASYPAKKGPQTQFLVEVPRLELKANEWGCLTVYGMGLGFTCVKREVVEKLARRSPVFSRNDEFMRMIFRTGIDQDGLYRSEDMHFFKSCREQGYEIHVDPNIELGHVGGKEYRGKLLDALTKKEMVEGGTDKRRHSTDAGDRPDVRLRVAEVGHSDHEQLQDNRHGNGGPAHGPGRTGGQAPDHEGRGHAAASPAGGAGPEHC